MEAVLTELLKSSPVAVAVLVTMIVFLKHVKSRDEAFEKQQERWQSVHDEREEKSGIIINENTKALGAISVAIQQLKDHVKA